MQVVDGWVMARGTLPSESIVAHVKTLTRDTAVAYLQRTGVEAVGVLEMGEAFAHEANRRRNLVHFVETGGGAKVPVLSSPHRIGVPAEPERLPGPPGADTARIFGQLVAG